MTGEPNERAVIGNNRSPFEISNEEITDLYGECKLWLDGEPVTTQEQADAINTLKAKVKEAAKLAETRYKDEVAPFQDSVKEIQTRWNDLIGSNKSVTGLAVKAEDALNAALKPYLLELDRQQREAARIAREEADKLAAEALAAMRNRDAANLQSREDAEKLLAAAKEAEKDARKATEAKAHAKGSGRATGLRTVWMAIMEDETEAARWVWQYCKPELITFIQGQADKAVRGGARKIHGFDIRETKEL